MKLKSYIFSFALLLIYSCDFIYKDNGLAGHSQTKEEANRNGSEVQLYIADRTSIDLFDGSKVLLDTAWTEVSFYYKNGKREFSPSDGYHFSIPFKKVHPNSYTFTFALLDTTNRAYTNGISEDLVQLCPLQLAEEMQVVVKQKDPDTSKGWTNPIDTDTITFRRITK